MGGVGRRIGFAVCQTLQDAVMIPYCRMGILIGTTNLALFLLYYVYTYMQPRLRAIQAFHGYRDLGIGGHLPLDQLIRLGWLSQHSLAGGVCVCACRVNLPYAATTRTALLQRWAGLILTSKFQPSTAESSEIKRRRREADEQERWFAARHDI